MARLIVNADDLGYTSGVDRAVLALHQARALGSATAMAAGDSISETAAALPPTLDLGCHVVLVDGVSSSGQPTGAGTKPAADPGLLAVDQPTLTRDGAFRPSLGRFAVDLLAGRIREREIENEAVAQIRSLQGQGRQLSHLDTHKHTHMLPRVLRPLLRAALRCGIRAIRNPFEPPWSRRAASGVPLLRRAHFTALSICRHQFHREVDRAGLQTTRGALGVLATGVLDAALLDRLLRALEQHGEPDGCYELVCHPGFHDATLESRRTRLRAERQREYEALLQVIPRWTGSDGPHRLVSFADL